MSEEDSSQETGAMEASKSEKAVWSDPQRRGDKQPLVRIYKLDFFIMPIACKSTCSFFGGGGGEEGRPTNLLTIWRHSALHNSHRRGCATWLYFHQAQQIVEASV